MRPVDAPSTERKAESVESADDQARSWLSVTTRAAARWGGTILTYGAIGTASSWASYGWFAAELWSPAPAFAGAAHSPPGAMGGALTLLTQPAGVLGVVFLLVIPAALLALGHAMGVQAAVKSILRDRRELLLKMVMKAAWPAVKGMSSAPGGATAHLKLNSLMEKSGEKGASRRVLGWVLRLAHVPELVSSASLLSVARERPEEAEQELAALIEQQFDELTESSALVPLWIACGVLLLLALTSGVWIPWLIYSALH